MASEDTGTGEGATRFADEILALRVFVACATRLAGPAGALALSESRQALVSAGLAHRSSTRCVRVDPRPSRRTGGAPNRILVDYLDLSVRLVQLRQEDLDLLLLYYVFRCPTEELAKALSIDQSSIAGRLSQARRALRVALAELLPPGRRVVPRRSALDAPTERREAPVDKRRSKVSRLMAQRLLGRGQEGSGAATVASETGGTSGEGRES